MLFFTGYKTDINRFLLLNIKHYPIRDPFRELIFLDPSVYELKNADEYSNIDKMHSLLENDELRENEFISIDYPADMNLDKQEEFVEKSIKNNLRYKDNPHYIATIQHEFKDLFDFRRQFDYLWEEIDFSKKIMGIGNMCRIMGCKNSFIINVKRKLKRYADEMCWVHFYGIGMRLLRFFINDLQRANPDLIISADNTKWTRGVNDDFIEKYGVACSSSNRNMYFLEYMKTLKMKYKIPVVY
jgi:hypothetical protein